MYADDICIFCPSAKGFRVLLQLCCGYANDHGIVFNSDKTKCVIFHLKKMTLCLPVITLKNTWLKVVKDVKYLGFSIDSHLRDDIDNRRQTKALYRVANKLHFNYFCCSKQAKILFIVRIACLCIVANYGVHFLIQLRSYSHSMQQCISYFAQYSTIH